MMDVKRLMDLLSKEDPAAEVLMLISDGDGFSPLDGFEVGKYVGKDPDDFVLWKREKIVHPNDEKKGKPVLLLWPVSD